MALSFHMMSMQLANQWDEESTDYIRTTKPGEKQTETASVWSDGGKRKSVVMPLSKKRKSPAALSINPANRIQRCCRHL
jgi:hypothetical protein